MRLGFVAACLVVFGLVAALITWSTPSTEPSKRAPATVTHLWDAGNVVGQGFLERFGVDFGGLDYVDDQAAQVLPILRPWLLSEVATGS